MILILVGVCVLVVSLLAGFFGLLLASDEAWEARPWFVAAMIGVPAGLFLVGAGVRRVADRRRRKRLR